MGLFSKQHITDNTTKATFIAILFHVVGFIGIVWIDTPTFAKLSLLNMLVTLALIVWTQIEKNIAFFLFLIACFFVGMVAEIIGVHSGVLFGNYAYGKVLGPAFKNVPVIIGINWFIIMYCCGVTMYMLQQKIRQRLSSREKHSFGLWSKASIIIDGALLAVLFDWIMEPVAVILGFWTWLGSGEIPFLNYISWFGISCILLLLFSFLKFNKSNLFAVHLLLIQTMFFLLLRTLL